MEKMIRIILDESPLLKFFWADAINAICYILNRALIRHILKKTLYELYFERKPNISHFHIFGCRCFVHNNGKDDLRKIDAKVDDVLFIEYSSTSEAF